MGQICDTVVCPFCNGAFEPWWIQYDGKHCPLCRKELPKEVAEAANDDVEEGFQGMLRSQVETKPKKQPWWRKILNLRSI